MQSATSTSRTPAVEGAQGPPRPAPKSHRLAGAGAIIFAVVVILQNLLRGLAPQSDAPIRDVIDYYTAHQSIEILLSVTFVVSGFALAIFLGGSLGRLTKGSRRMWAYTGYAGGIGIIALFSALIGTEDAMSALASRGVTLEGAFEALWTLHNGLFAALLLSIAIALFGLARAGIEDGMTPPAFSALAPLGAVLLALGAAVGPRLAAGTAMPLFALSGVGFLTWVAFLASTGTRLLQGR